ncbi:MAG TPA: diguanylate cyclase [Candidatus Binatia bacterium]|nr:diguanylate cyclase [Candidatus Binatia bacterium]
MDAIQPRDEPATPVPLANPVAGQTAATLPSASGRAAEPRAAAPGDGPAATRPERAPYPPTAYFLRQNDDEHDRTEPVERATRFGLRLRSDTPLLVAIAIAIPVLVMQAATTATSFGLLAPVVFVAAQLWLATLRITPPWLPTARLAMSLAFIGIANLWGDPTGTWPMSALAVPIVALAAALGGRGPTVVAVLGMAMIIAPLALPAVEGHTRLEVGAVAMAAVVVAIGSRRVVANLERSSARLRRANLRARRRARELAAIESVGQLLARDGPTPDALDRVMGVLEQTFGYRYPSVYLWDGTALQLGAQRNYRYPIQTINPDRGILGRVVHSRAAAFLQDARSDPDFLSADPDVVSEIAIPLLVDGELFGVLNVETSGDHRLDDDDFSTMQIVGDRLAAALALGRERQKLTERTALLDRLTVFATVLGSSLDPATMDDEVVRGASHVIPADMVLLVVRDPASADYRVNAVSGGDAAVLGQPIRPGEGVTGRAIVTRSVVVSDRLERGAWPRSMASIRMPDVLTAMAAPMVVGEEVVGVVTWLRADLGRPFTAQEREVAQLLASKVGLALANARLHQQTRNAAITDPLTGIHNRRHFDATVERDDAVRRRIPAEKRRMRSAILFDLDHFGKVNKRYGHQVGDRVLKQFADTLKARVRASDLVARYGGEEFVVVLDNASREDAAIVAEAVRTAFGRLSVDAGNGETVTTTVSAGCATLEPWEVESSVLLERADVALAMAKNAGRDKVVTA